MVTFNMKNVKIENNVQLSNLSIPAYLECGQCKKHSKLDAGGQCKCPHCGSTFMARLEVGDGKPRWFDATKIGE